MEGQRSKGGPADVAGVGMGGGEVDPSAADGADGLAGDGVGDDAVTVSGDPIPRDITLDRAHTNPSNLLAKI